MTTAQRINKSGRTYYRVQIRRPAKGVNIDEYFTTKRSDERFLRMVSTRIESGEPIAQNVREVETFQGAVDSYLEDPKCVHEQQRPAAQTLICKGPQGASAVARAGMLRPHAA